MLGGRLNYRYHRWKSLNLIYQPGDLSRECLCLFRHLCWAFDARPPAAWPCISCPAKMAQQAKPFSRRVNLQVDKLDYEIRSGGINNYYVTTIVVFTHSILIENMLENSIFL